MNEMHELIDSLTQPDYSMHAARRDELLTLVRKKYPEVKSGAIVLFAGIEQDCMPFRQDSSFYYFTGIQEPAMAMIIELTGKTIFYVPQFTGDREQWVESEAITDEHSEQLGCDLVTALGDPCSGYQVYPFAKKETYRQLIAHIEQIKNQGGKLFVLAPDNEHAYVNQRTILSTFKQWIPGLSEAIVDISGIVAHMRRIKDAHEIDALLSAIVVTKQAQEAAIATIAEGDVMEADVKAAIEHTFIALLARAAFPSIVATGLNGTILHYVGSKRRIMAGELVVIDIGAEVLGYCADITRTYPASGKFSKRQRELYTIVLDTQQHIADLAKPGMWLSNAQYPDKSLNHLARGYLKDKGYDQYFPHGIGHFLGLDVHDVGDYLEPLAPGDVITIEPGIYLPHEEVGIRIEDNYLITEKGADCLSAMIPKTIVEIEEAMRRGGFPEEPFAERFISDISQQSH